MLIGSWGPIVFEISGELAKTFSEMTQKSAGRWAEHNPVNTKPLSEFLGPGLDELEMQMIFSKALGVEPQESYDELREETRKGEHYPLILGGFPLSGNFWYVKEISAVSKAFGPRDGKILWQECTVNFKEYN